MSSDSRHPVKSTIDQLRSVWARSVQAAPDVPRFFEEGARWGLETAAATLPCQWARHLASETKNKLFAYSEFQSVRRNSINRSSPQPFGRDPYTSIWRAEGFGAHIAENQQTPPLRLADVCSDSAISSSYQVPIHTGGGLALAEAVLKKHHEPAKELAIGEMLSDLHSSIEEQAHPGLHSAVFEALGLVLQTMHPELLAPVADHLKKEDLNRYRLLWHGAGRGFYFDPFQMMLPSSIRTRSYLSDTDDAGLNRLSGYAWAITLVNIRSPKAAVAIISNLPISHERSLSAAIDGVSAAALLWLATTDDSETLARFEKALTADSAFENSSHRDKFGEALAKRTASHPISCVELGAIFAYDPDQDSSD